MKNICSFIVFQVLKVPLEICKIQPQNLLFLVVLLAFTSANIIFHKYLELHSTLSEKRFSSRIFLFLMDSLKSPTKLPKSAKRDKSFLLMLP